MRSMHSICGRRVNTEDGTFFVLGYLGVKSPTYERTLMAQIGTLVYFSYFVLMPWYTRVEKTKPEPERVTS